jgi:hypothetical protein
MTRAFGVNVDVSQLQALAPRLDRVSGEMLGRTALEVVNEVTVRAYDAAIAGETEGINLTPEYVKSKTDLTLATNPAAPLAEIVTRGDLTILGHFDPVTVRDPGAPRRAGPIVGQRSAGVRVSILRGQEEFQPQWFVMRLRAGDNPGENFGVFVRTSASGGKPQHIYGPSPYSLFAHQVGTHEEDILADLQATAASRFADAVGGAFA